LLSDKTRDLTICSIDPGTSSGCFSVGVRGRVTISVGLNGSRPMLVHCCSRLIGIPGQ